MPMPLPPVFAYLAQKPGPKILLAALADFGLHELPGPANSPRIMEMARLVGAADYYTSDSISWCALAMSAWVRQAGFALPPDPLAAKNWALFGQAAPGGVAMLGDVLVMARPGGHHVTMYVGEYKDIYYAIGGNQGNQVGIAGFEKSRITHVRRCPWKIAEPREVRRIIL